MTEKTPGDEKAVKTEAATVPEPSRRRPAKPKKSANAKKRAPRVNGRGRPPWQPSIEDRTAVEQMKYVGESDAMIARALKVDVDTLRKHCAYELENGYANQRRKVTAWLFESAGAKNTSAIKRLDEMGKISGAAAAMKDRENGIGAQSPVAPAKPAKLGKKEERQVAAERVASSGKFQPPSAPKLVVNNAVNE